MTPAQLTTLRAAIDGNPAWAAFAQNDDGYYALAQALNQPASPAFSVWRTDAPVNAITDAINWSLYTPSETLTDAALTTDLAVQKAIVRALYCQTKQMNLQLMLQGRATLDCSKPNIRAGLRDAVIQVPSGAAGAATAPGGASGATVLGVCTRNATEAEKALVTASQGSDTTGATTARVLGFEGFVTAQDVSTARNL